MPATMTKNGTARPQIPPAPVSAETRTATPATAKATSAAASRARGEKRARRRWLAWPAASMPSALTAKRTLYVVGETPYRCWKTNDEPPR